MVCMPCEMCGGPLAEEATLVGPKDKRSERKDSTSQSGYEGTMLRYETMAQGTPRCYRQIYDKKYQSGGEGSVFR